jgi:geranylgeranyl reductase family protein
VTTCDVLIVGGGPAGSSCAWKLRRAGLTVIVWDRRPFPRDKICAGWITPQILAELQLDPEAYAAGGLTFQAFSGFAIGRLGDGETRVRYGRPVSYGIRRCEFDQYLLRRSGAQLRLGQPVHTLQRRNGEWVLNDTVCAKLLVGAGGHFCAVAQLLGAKLGTAEPIVAAQEAEFELSASQQLACEVEPDVPEIFFTRDLKGYGWVVRKGSYINIGLGRQDSLRLAEHVARFVAFLEQRGKIPEHLPAKFHGHPYLLYGAAQRPLLGDAALVIGDAAGLAYAKSGEGIRPAIESGLLAADTILEADGTYSREGLAGYERRVVARFGPRRTRPGVTDVLPHWIAGPLAGRLFTSAWFARRVVVDRWFLHRQQPPLAKDPSQSAALGSGQERRPAARSDSNPNP